MPEVDWIGAEEVLFKRSRAIMRHFANKHPSEALSLFAYTLDAEYAGAALNFDTPANSLQKAKAHHRYEVEYRNTLFASEHGWQNARYFVADPTRQVGDFNRRGPWQYELVQFVQLDAWEECYNSSEETPELEGHVIASLWRVVDRLVEAGAFEVLRRVAPFRVGFEFHDAEFVVLRILEWPSDGVAGQAE